MFLESRCGTLSVLTPFLAKCRASYDIRRNDAVISGIEAMNSKKAADWNYFKYLRREVSRELRSAKERYEAEYLDVADPKQQWARIMRMTGLEAREKSSLVLEVDGKRMDSPEETAEYMNQFFKTKVDRLIENLDPSVEEAINYMKEYLDNKKVG